MQIITFSNTQVEVQSGTDDEGNATRTIVIAEILPIQVPGAPPMPTRIYRLDLNADVAKQVGSALMAPSLEVAQTIEMPTGVR